MSKQQVWARAFSRRAWVTLMPKATIFLFLLKGSIFRKLLRYYSNPSPSFLPPQGQKTQVTSLDTWSGVVPKFEAVLRGSVCCNTVCGIRRQQWQVWGFRISDWNYDAAELSINMWVCRRRLRRQSLSDEEGANLLIKHHILICYNNTLAWQNQWLWFGIHVFLWAYLPISWACVCSEEAFPEAAVDVGGGSRSGGHGEDCWELRGRPPLWDVFSLVQFCCLNDLQT